MSIAPKILKPTLVLLCFYASYFILVLLAYFSYLLIPALTRCFDIDMGFIRDKKKKLADLLAKQRAVATGASLSTPLAPSSSAARASLPANPAPPAVEPRGGVAVESDDEDICTGLVFKRPRVGVIVAPSLSASPGTPTFIDHPPSASSLLLVAALQGGGESSPGGQETDSSSPLPLLLKKPLSRFQSREVEGLDDNLFHELVAEVLRDLLFTSKLELSKTRESEDLKAKMAKLEEDLATRTKTFTNRETALYLELANLRQSEKDAIKALQDKSLEAVELEARILPLRTRAVELDGIVAELKEKVANMENRSTQREILLGQVEDEMAEKSESLVGAIESLRRTEEELTNGVAAVYSEGFQDVVAQFCLCTS